MLTVVKISQGRGPFYKVEFSNGEKLRLSEDTVVRHRLLKGQELEEKTLNEIKQEGKEDLGFQMALNYLSYQLRTEKEIRAYLKDNEIESGDRHKIVARLKELNLVDDLVYSESYIRTQMRLGDKGPRILQQKLKQKGVKEPEIEQALYLYESNDQFQVALHTAQKALRKYHHSSQREVRQKIQQLLMTKGFNSDISKGVLAELDFSDIQEQETDALTMQGNKLWRKNQRFEPAKRRQKVKQSLYQKGFQLDQIDAFIQGKEDEHE
ncbi:recombination regulator RecX [Enterococcus gilvus]|jgi:regulatory protein|uniref:recombination regulator RecX n=1 Tax=Enterococcus gilvus TaxID=160453 RepID=UPI000DF5F5BC|nr:recombination regulator RecX [Enterococcus gilvus]AXG38640.1 recombination regulator RecX [Enterococcus gilvus]